MTIKELQEKRSKLFHDAQSLVQGTDVTIEQRSQFDAMLKDVEGIEADINRLKALDEYRAKFETPVFQPAPKPGASAMSANEAEHRAIEARSAFTNYLRTGRVESRDLTISANGAVMVPTGFDPVVREAQLSYGDIYNLVNVMKTDNGEPIKLVLDNDTGNSLTNLTVGTNASEVDPSISGLTLQVDPLTTGVIRIDNGLLQDAGFDVEAFIRDKFAKRFFRGVSNLIVNGNGGNVGSLLTAYSGGSTTVSSATAATLGYADFVEAIATLDPAYHANAVFAMSNATLGQVLKLVDSNNRPLFLPQWGDAEKGFIGQILGFPVKCVQQLPTVATGHVSVLFGDFSEGYTFRQQNPGIGILRLNELYAAGYETGFVGFCRAGGLATDAGTHPIVGIKIS